MAEPTRAGAPATRTTSNSNQEAFTGKIDLKEDDLETVNRMIIYLYTLDYDDGVQVDFDSNNVWVAFKGDPPGFPKTTQHATSTNLPAGARVIVKSDMEQAMQNNVLVYAMADKFNIPELKLLAKNKFAACANLHWPPTNFNHLVTTVYTTTPETDHDLRDVVARLASIKLEEVQALEDFQTTAADLGSFSLDLLKNVVIKNSAERKEHQRKVAHLLAESTRFCEKLQTANKTIDSLTHQLQRSRTITADLMRVLESTSECRHCKAEISAYMELPVDATGPVTLRCSKCKTRHQLA